VLCCPIDRAHSLIYRSCCGSKGGGLESDDFQWEGIWWALRELEKKSEIQHIYCVLSLDRN